MDENELLQSLLASVKDRESGRWGVRTAKDYLATFGLTAPPGVDDPSLWPQHLTAAESKLVYANEDMTVLDAKASGLALEKTEGSLLDFACVLTATTKDRDGDILESAGAELDPQMPLLWQHLPTQPIGKMVKKLSQDARDVRVHFAIANTTLGRDAATLAEFGALRLSHGFRPIEAEPIKGASHGWHVKRFATFEGSLVSIPSNVSGVITAFSREKLHHPLVKSWAKAHADARPAAVVVPPAIDDIKSGRVLSAENEKKIKTAHALLHEVVQSNARHDSDGKSLVDAVGELVKQLDAKGGKPACSCKCAACAKCAGMPKGAMVEPKPGAGMTCKCGCGACQKCMGAPKDASPDALKVYVPIEGSWDWIRSKLAPTLSTYLMGKGKLGRSDYAWIDSMFPDAAMVCVDSYPRSTCWKLAWKLTDGVPAWDGEPVAVEVVARMEEIKAHHAAIAKRAVESLDATAVSGLLAQRLMNGAALSLGAANILTALVGKAQADAAGQAELESLNALLN